MSFSVLSLQWFSMVLRIMSTFITMAYKLIHYLGSAHIFKSILYLATLINHGCSSGPWHWPFPLPTYLFNQPTPDRVFLNLKFLAQIWLPTFSSNSFYIPFIAPLWTLLRLPFALFSTKHPSFSDINLFHFYPFYCLSSTVEIANDNRILVYLVPRTQNSAWHILVTE